LGEVRAKHVRAGRRFCDDCNRRPGLIHQCGETAVTQCRSRFPDISVCLRQAGADSEIGRIAAFAAASGKQLISWHAGSDNLLSSNDHVRNYVTITAQVKSLDVDPATSTRMFIVAGATHGQASALTEVNWFAAITGWVENNVAPNQLTYNWLDAATGMTRTLPVCQNPLYARYNGSGDINSAASYTCTVP